MNYEATLANSIIFDQNEYYSSATEKQYVAYKIADTILQISGLVIDFAAIERVPRYCKFKRENDAEHSLMLALAGVEIASEYFPGFDTGLIGKLALVHDFPELKTGDVATFDITDEELRQKHQNEARNVSILLKELPPHIGDLLTIYEEQELPEAEFVKHVDKLLPNAVNIKGGGLQVMSEDYKVSTTSEFFAKNETLETRFKKTFGKPEHEPLHLAHSVLAHEFALLFPE